MDPRNKDGVRGRCKACVNEEQRAYAATPEAKDKAAARMRKWRARNPEKVKEKNAAWRAIPGNLERHRALTMRWREENPEQYVAGRDRWQKANRDRRSEHQRQRIARKRDAFVAEVVLDDLIQRDLGICGICLDPIMGPIQIDHIVPLAAGGEHSPENCQLSHPRCNQRKGAKTDYAAA